MQSLNLSLGEEYSNQLAKFLPEALNQIYDNWALFAHSYTHHDRGRAILGSVERSGDGDLIIHDGLIKDMKTSYAQILKFAANFVDAVPVAPYDVININELEKIAFKPVNDFLVDKLLKGGGKERSGEVFYPEEVAFIVERISRAYHLPSQILGRSLLHLTLSNEPAEDLTNIIKNFYGFTNAFYVKWKGKFNCKYGEEGKKQLAIICYYLVDSHNGSRRQILPWVIKNKKPEILIEESPQEGIKRVIMGNWRSRRRSEREINLMLKKMQQTRLTPSQLMRLRSDRNKYGGYLRELYQNGRPDIEKGKNSVFYID